MRDSWTARDGLPSTSVRAFEQTSDGFLWVATTRGLARFDGARFVPAFDGGDRAALADPALAAIAQPRPGEIWLASDRGAGLIRVAADGLRVFLPPDGLPHHFVRRLAVDQAGVLWVGTARGVARVDVDRQTITRVDGDDRLGLASVRALAIDRDQTLWVGLDDGLARLAQGRLVREGLRGVPVHAVAGLRDGQLWAGGEQGLFVRRAGHWTPEPALASRRITALLQDRQGAVWVGTTTGLGRWRDGAWHQFPEGDPLSTGLIRTLFQDAEGGIWVGLGSAPGFLRLREPPFTRLTTREGLSSDDVRSVAQARDGALWVTTSRGLDRVTRIDPPQVQTFDVRHGMPGEGLVTAMSDQTGRVWALSSAGRVVRLQGGLFTNVELPGEASALFADDVGPVYVAAARGVWRIDGEQKTMLTLARPDLRRVRGFQRGASGRVYTWTEARLYRIDGDRVVTAAEFGTAVRGGISMVIEEGDNLWVATGEAGLLRLSAKGVGRIRSVDGLHSDRLETMVLDAQGALWGQSGDGIFRVAVRDLVSFDERRAGALVSVVDRATAELRLERGFDAQPGAWRTTDGRLLFATGNGLLMYDRGQRGQPRPVHPIVDRVSVDGHAVPLQGREVPSGARLTVAFTAPAMADPEDVRFRYRLAGLEDAWTDPGQERSVSYAALRPGLLRFELEARRGDGPWTAASKTLQLRVIPPFYRRAWFIALTAVALALVGIGAHRLRLRQARARYEVILGERNRIARDVHDTLAQSFVAISVQLESVRRALDTHPDEARVGLDRASVAVDRGVEESRRAVRALRTEVLERSDLEGALRAVAASLAGSSVIAFEVMGHPQPLPEPVEEGLLRIGQEAITNAVRHGRARHVQVTLSFGVMTRRFFPWSRRLPVTLAVQDDGVGFDPRARVDGHGLRGLRERVQKLRGRLTIDSAKGRGTVITVEVRA